VRHELIVHDWVSVLLYLSYFDKCNASKHSFVSNYVLHIIVSRKVFPVKSTTDYKFSK